MKNNFSENLKKIRKENNLSQEELAEELNVSRQSISKWESAQAYPEMDKIITICNKFNVNIDDLLYKDIKETTSEKTAKNNLNKYIDDFLKFITDSINLFTSMNLSSKIKCILEQLVIIFIIFILSLIIGSIGESILYSLFNFLPANVINIHINIISAIYKVFIFVSMIIIIVHIFKTRYLDYYHEIKEETKDEKIEFKEEKIVIRDPKHSDYKFINGLFKFIVILFKVFLSFATLFLCFGLVMLFICFTMTFLISKSGLIFIGIVGIILSLSVIDIIFIIAILNFIFNRLSNKKVLIHSFIIALIILGISAGLTFTGSLDLKVTKDSSLEQREVEYKMNDNIFINNYKEIEYKEKDINNIKIEYKINKYCQLDDNTNTEHGIQLYGYCENPFEITKEFINNINKKKLTTIDYEVKDIVVYANHTNIGKLKKNKEEYEKRHTNFQDTINYYEEKIYEYEERINKLEKELDTYKNKQE